MEDKDKKEYELAVLVASEEQVPTVVALVRSNNGELTSEPRAKRITLAYEIEKHKDAIFASFTFKALGEDVKNLENALRMAPEVIRSLIVIAVVFSGGGERQMSMPPSMMKQRRTRTMRSDAPTTSDAPRLSAPKPLSNEALEKKIEEILQ